MVIPDKEFQGTIFSFLFLLLSLRYYVICGNGWERAKNRHLAQSVVLPARAAAHIFSKIPPVTTACKQQGTANSHSSTVPLPVYHYHHHCASTATESITSLACPSTSPRVVCGRARQLTSTNAATMKKWLMRPFKLNCLVRTRFEEAAIRYAAEVRRATRFPHTVSAADTPTTTVITTTSITTALPTPHGSTRRGRRVVPTQPVRPIVHVAEPSPPTPLPLRWIHSRQWDEGDTIVRGIQEMRSQFVQPESEHFPRQRQPHPQRPSRRPPPLPVSPPRDVIPRRVRPVWPLFRGGGGRGRGGSHVQDEEDEWVDIEEVSPPRTTYHLYRLSADGTPSALPITVIPSSSASLHAPNPTNHGANDLLDHEDFRSQRHASVTVTQQSCLPLISTAQQQQSHFSNSRYMGHQMALSQSSQQLTDSGVVSHPPTSRYHRKPLVFTVPQEQKAGNPAGTTTTPLYVEDDDLQLLSDGDVNLIEISSDSSPEVDSEAQDSRRMPDRDSHFPQVSAASSQAGLRKGLPRLSSPANTSSSKLLTSEEDEELPDLTCSQSPARPPCKDDNRAEGNLSDVSTIVFEDMNFEEWMDDDFEDVATSTSSGESTKGVHPLTCSKDAAASHAQTENIITMVIDNLEVVTLPCAEQCTNSTAEGKQSDAIDHDITNYPQAEQKSDDWSVKNIDITPQQDIRSGEDTLLTGEVMAQGDDKMKEAASVNSVHDEKTEVTKEDNIQQMTNDPPQDGVASEKGEHNALVPIYRENKTTEAVPQKVTRFASTEEVAPQEGNEPSDVAPTGPPETSNTPITDTSVGSVGTRKASMNSGAPGDLNNIMVDEVESSSRENTKDEGTETIRTLGGKDKTVEEPIIPASYSEKKSKLRCKTKVKMRKRRSARPKKVQEQEKTWRRHGGGSEDFLEIVDPSCTLFVSDGQLIVAMRVPRATEQEEENVTLREVSDEHGALSQYSIPEPTPLNSPVHLRADSSPRPPPATAASLKRISNACERNEHEAAKSETGDATISLEERIVTEDKEQTNMYREETDGICERSGEVTQENEGCSEEIKARETEENTCKESEANQILESPVDGWKKPKKIERSEAENVRTNETEELNATHISLLCQTETLDETLQDTENETWSETNKASEYTPEARSIADTELHCTLSGAPEENPDTGKISDKNLKNLTQDSHSNAKTENTKLIVVIQEEKERKMTPKLIPEVAEEGVPEEEEKGVTSERISGVEEKRGFPERVPGIEKKRGTPERVPGIEKRGTPERVPGIEKRGTPERVPETEKRGTPERVPETEKRETPERVPETEKRETPERVPEIEEKRGTPERVPRIEKRGAPERVPGIEEKRGTPERVPGIEKRGTPERVPGIEKRGTPERVPGIEKRGTPERVPETEKRGTPERVPETEKRETPERVPEIEEKRGTPERVPGIEKRGTPERVPGIEEKRGTPERVPGIEKRGTPERVPETEKRETPERVPETEKRETPERVPEIEEKRGTPERVPGIEKRGTPERVPGIEAKRESIERVPRIEEKRRSIERVPGIEEKRGIPERVPEVKEKRRTPEGVPEIEEKRRYIERVPEIEERIVTPKHTPGVEKKGVTPERTHEVVEIRGEVKDAVDTSESSERKDDGGCIRHNRSALRRSANTSNTTSISHLAERLLALKLRGRLTRPLAQPQTLPDADRNVSTSSDPRPSGDKGDSQTQESMPIPMDSAALCRQRHMDALKGLVEELRLMGERRMNARLEERPEGVYSFDAAPVKLEELPHAGDPTPHTERNGKVENTGLTIIQCVAEVHHSADEVSKDFSDRQFKLPQPRVECEAPRGEGDSEQGYEEKHYKVAANAGSTDETQGVREEERHAYRPLEEIRDIISNMEEVKEALECPRKHEVVETITKAHDGGKLGLVTDRGEVDERKTDVPPSSGSTRTSLPQQEPRVGFDREGGDSAALVEVCEDFDFRDHRVPVAMKTKGSKQLPQRNGECDAAGKEDPVLPLVQGINIKIMNNEHDAVPQPSPPPSVSDFVRKVSMKINQLHAESSVARPQQDGSLRPREFSHTLQDFRETVHCGQGAQEKLFPAAPLTDSNAALGLHLQQHGADTRIEGLHLSSSETHPSSSISDSQPAVCETHPSIKETQSSSSTDQTTTDQPQPSTSRSQQSSEVGPPTPSESQPSIGNNGNNISSVREKRWMEESADEESEVEGSRGRKRRRKDRGTTRHHIVEVPLTERYEECLRMLATAGEAFVSRLQSHGVMGPSHRFATLQPDHTRSLLNQMVRTRRGRCQPSREENTHYKGLLALHGFIKAADLLRHCGLESALHCLDQFHRTHHVLLAECYTEVVARLAAVLECGGEGIVHPKVTTLRREMQRARQRGDPGDTEFKVLVVVRREAQWVCRQLEKEFGSDNVALLSRLPEYDHVLHLLEQRSVMVWEEGEALHQLPCSQFSLVVEWEGRSGSSVCVDHCTRQNIHVVSFTEPSPNAGDKGSASKDESRDHREGKSGTDITSRNDSTGGIRSIRGCGQRDSLTVVASNSVTANNELHYILTSMFDINLVERNVRDVMIEEGRQGWADLLLDERTCVLLRPLATLRSDVHLNELTCQLVLLSLQCTTCYIILYTQQSNSSGYEFRSSVVRALTRLVATCVLFRSPEYTVSLLLAYTLHQVGEVVRDLCEAARASSPVWDPDEWTTRPWLTSQLSSHERLLLSLPCINSISAQVILTAMSLLQVLESSLSQMRKALPWIPDKVIMMLYKLVHGEPITDIKVGRYTCGSTKGLLTKEDGNILYRSKTMTDADQKATDDPQFLSHSVYNLEDSHNSKTAYIPVEERNLDETTLFCEEEERLVPPVPSIFLPDKLSLFTANDVKYEYTSTTNTEAVPVSPYLNTHDTAVIPTTIVPSKELTRTNSSSHTATAVPVAGTSKYGSTHLSASCMPLPGSTNLHSLLNTDSKDSSNDLFNPYKYLHFMEHDKRTGVQPQQECRQLSQQAPWQYQQSLHHHQQPPQQYQQSLQQYQQLPQSQHCQQLPQQFLQEQGHHEPKKDGDVLIVSPYFPNFHDPLIDAKQSVAPSQQYHDQNPPQPSTITSDHYHLPPTSTQFLPQIWNESFRLQTSVHPYSNVAGSSVTLENSRQHQQGSLPYQQQVYTNKVLGIAKPQQWHDVKNKLVSPHMTVHQSQQDCDFSDTCNFSTYVKSITPGQSISEDNTTRLLYEKVPGWGGQTKLVFNSS